MRIIEDISSILENKNFRRNIPPGWIDNGIQFLASRLSNLINGNLKVSDASELQLFLNDNFWKLISDSFVTCGEFKRPLVFLFHEAYSFDFFGRPGIDTLKYIFTVLGERVSIKHEQRLLNIDEFHIENNQIDSVDLSKIGISDGRGLDLIFGFGYPLHLIGWDAFISLRGKFNEMNVSNAIYGLAHISLSSSLRQEKPLVFPINKSSLYAPNQKAIYFFEKKISSVAVGSYAQYKFVSPLSTSFMLLNIVPLNLMVSDYEIEFNYTDGAQVSSKSKSIHYLFNIFSGKNVLSVNIRSSCPVLISVQSFA